MRLRVTRESAFYGGSVKIETGEEFRQHPAFSGFSDEALEELDKMVIYLNSGESITVERVGDYITE